MSDDLISRKALLDRFRYGDKESESDKAWICAVRRMIKEQPTAFNKEKVIDELVELRQIEYRLAPIVLGWALGVKGERIDDKEDKT